MLHISPYLCSVSFWFGLIVGFGGFIGLTLGSALSYFLRPRIRDAIQCCRDFPYCDVRFSKAVRVW